MKKHLFVTIFISFLLPLFSFSQAIQWQNTIGGNGTDWLRIITQTNDGGYILGGYSLSDISGDKTENGNGGYDYWIVKIDSLGVIQWQNTIGGSDNDLLFSVTQTSDGGYFLGGKSESNISGDKTEDSHGGWDFWVVKTDSIGNIQWQNTIGGNNIDDLHSFAQTSDGGYILGGRSDSNISGDKTENSIGTFDYWIVKTDSLGVIQWQNTIGGNSIDELYSITHTPDGGYILGGWSDSNISGDKSENSDCGYDYWIIKTDGTGIIQWQKTIGGSNWDNFYSLKKTSDGGYIMGGTSNSNISGDKIENCQGGVDYWIVKIDNTGAIQWQNTIGGNNDDEFYSIAQTLDGGYILGGPSMSNISGDKTENSNGNLDYWIVKIDNTGAIQWQNTIGGNFIDHLTTVAQSTDGDYILGGGSWSNISGDKTENCNGSFDYWIIKIAGNPTSLNEYLNENEVLQLYPNPANLSLTVETRDLMASDSKLTITDVAGRTLITKSLDNNSTKHQIDISSFSSGIYFVQIDGGNGIERGRFVKE